MRERNFQLLLLAVAIASLVPVLIMAWSQFLSYDGYWHVFIATQNRWRIFVSEWKADAHPPLFYLLLRLCGKVSRSRFAYRIPAVVPGVAGVYFVGLAARRLFSSSVLALVAAAAYGVSSTLIEIFTDVRGYALALFFVIASFWYLIRFLENDKRALLRFSVLVSLGILTEYYVVFYLAACIVVFFVQRKWRAVAVACILPCLIMAWLYFVHLRIQPSTENNVVDFYWNGHDSVWAFLWSGIRSDLAYLMPFGLDTSHASLLAVFILAMLVASIALRSLPAQILGLLLIELAILGITRRYPFGGYARQQSVLFPFIVLTVFGFVDLLVRSAPYKMLRVATAACAAAVVTTSFVYDWRHIPKISKELFTDTYSDFTRISRSPAVYVDQFSLIAYYIHTHSWKWTIERRLQCPERVDIYETVSPGGDKKLLVRNLDEWNFDLTRPDTYNVLATALQESHLTSIDLFYYRQGGENMSRDIASEKLAIHKLAGQAGLGVSDGIYNNAEALMTFTLRDTSAS